MRTLRPTHVPQALPNGEAPSESNADSLSDRELTNLFQHVFRPKDFDHRIGILVDLPDQKVPDNPYWRRRRQLAKCWIGQLESLIPRLGIKPTLLFYRNVRNHNADLPDTAWSYAGGPLPQCAEETSDLSLTTLTSIFKSHTILIALTEFSATAPLKLAARRYNFRAATMPGFCADMIPALRLDYTKIHERVAALKGWLDLAIGSEITFVVGSDELFLYLDLRHRTAIASDGLVREVGMAANLPSGEACIAPYEGELAQDRSRSNGTLPVQFGEEVVLFEIEQNRAVAVRSTGKESLRQASLLKKEPAYGNVAELGLGVLSDFGIHPIGQILLDEKLGLHIAFGRSDHLGGNVDVTCFTKPESVIHIDWIFLPEIQPMVHVKRMELVFPFEQRIALIENDSFNDFLADDSPLLAARN